MLETLAFGGSALAFGTYMPAFNTKVNTPSSKPYSSGREEDVNWTQNSMKTTPKIGPPEPTNQLSNSTKPHDIVGLFTTIVKILNIYTMLSCTHL